MHRTQEPVTAFDDELRAWSPTWSPRCTPPTASAWPPARSAWTGRCSSSTAPTTTGVQPRRRGLQPRAVPARGQGPPASTTTTRAACRCPARSCRARRPSYARVEGQGLDGAPVSYAGDGLLARCLQHETDHCHGTVFGDRLNKRARKKLFKEADEAAADFPAGWPA